MWCDLQRRVPPAFPTRAPAPQAPSDRARSANCVGVNAPDRKVRRQTREGAAMPGPRERIACALSRLQGHPPDIRFEGEPMWQSFLAEADAALAAADIDPLIALLRQIETHAAVPEALRDQAATVLRGYAAGTAHFRPQRQEAPSPGERSGHKPVMIPAGYPIVTHSFSCDTWRLPPESAVHRTRGYRR